MQYSADIQKLKHSFLPEHFSLTNWATLEPYFIQLQNREINSSEDLEQWLKDMSEMEAFISEDACWRQVRMTCDTENKTLEEDFNFFFMEIQPKIQPYADILNKKLVDSPFTTELDQEKYFTYLRSVKKSIDLFREANIPLQAEAAVLQQQYGSIAGKMMIEQDGQEYTLQQAGKFLESEDRNIRETVYKKISERRLVDKEPLNELFSKLVALRHQVALNAGFSNYRDYKFAEMGRFDYTPASCFQFHEAVKKEVLPLVNQIYQEQQQRLGLDNMRPWDTEAEPAGIEPLRPFTDGRDLLDKWMHSITLT
jgi:oligoendopeptidase F